MAHHPSSPLYAPTIAGRKARVETQAEIVKKNAPRWVGRGGTAKGAEDRMAKWLAADDELKAKLEKRWHEEDTLAAAADEERKAKQAESAAAFEQAKASIAGVRSKRPGK